MSMRSGQEVYELYEMGGANSYEQLPGSTDTAASFEFINEGHTMGNALRYIIMKKYLYLYFTNTSNCLANKAAVPMLSSAPTQFPIRQSPK